MPPEGNRFRWLCLALFVFALAVRLFTNQWDQGHAFHPDERRIGEAVDQLSFRPLQLDPHFFAYGSLPMYAARGVLSLLGPVRERLGSYGGAIAVGRACSAFWGAGTVLLLVLLGRRLYGARAGLLAGFFLAVAVLHVQNSHFFTSDVPLTALVLLSLLFQVRFVDTGRVFDAAAAGLALGLALATKISALPLLLPLGLAFLIRGRVEGGLLAATGRGALALACVALGFGIGEPYAFLDPQFRHDIVEQSQMVRNAGVVPYTNQYVGTPKYLYDLKEIVLWGLGPALGLAGIWGALRRFRRGTARSRAEWLLLAWVIPFFAITGSFDVKFPRYLLPIYPFLALWAAAWLTELGARSRAGRWLLGGVVIASVAWLAAFLGIYTRPHTVVTASEWFFRDVRPGTKVLSQDWDEGFPFPLPGKSPDAYKIVNFGFYEPDAPQKMEKLATELASSELIVFQTKRLYGAVTQAHEKFPLTSRFFSLLFGGDLGFTLTREFASRPSLLGIEVKDELADESFSVYDHPKVLVFRKTTPLSAEQLRSKILGPLPVRPLNRHAILAARPASGAVEGGASPARTRSSIVATLRVMLFLEALGLAAFAILSRLIGPRAGGYAFAKVAGVLLFAWGSWLAASIGWLRFEPPLLLGTAALLLALGFAAWRRRGAGSVPWREVAVTEAAVQGSFLFFLGVRALNPEIFWGEKPMDFAFLNTLTRSGTLPPAEPWFAGSPLHYTYFGHYLVAAVGKALAIEPAVMFNLGIALTAGLAAAALFAGGAALTGRARTGAVAAFLTLFVGNLSGLRELVTRKIDSFDTFWATSRVIKDTVNEYPFWSFLFADLHAHLLVLPFTAGFVAALIFWTRRPPDTPAPRGDSVTLAALAALLLGAVGVTSGWSLPTYVALTPVLLATAWIGTGGGRSAWTLLRTGLSRVLLPSAAIVAGAFLLFAPFWRVFVGPPRNWGLEKENAARPYDALEIFGLFVVILAPFLVMLWRRAISRNERALTWGERLATRVFAGLLLLSLVDLRALLHGSVHQAASFRVFAFLLCFLGLVVAWHPGTSPAFRVPAALAGFALGVIAGCDVVYVWDRMNTVFKFYLEAQVLLALATAVALEALVCGAFGRDRRFALWKACAVAALALGLLTSLVALNGLMRPRRIEGPRFTLDGTAYLAASAPFDAAAIDWLNRNVPGLPVLVEAWGPSYGGFSRISMNTGLPIVLGWDYHVYQRAHAWREIDRRKADVETIYTARDEERVRGALRRYHAALVYVGPLERTQYPGSSIPRFREWSDLLAPLYENAGVTVFAVRDAFSAAIGSPVVENVAEERTDEGAASPPQDAEGHLRQPRDVAFDPDGNVYVTDFANNRIQKFDAALQPVVAWGKRGKLPGEFADPCGLAFGPEGLVVADTWNSRVQVFDPQGKWLREASGDFFGPRGVAVDADGTIFLSDSGNSRIARFSREGKVDLKFGSKGDGPDQLYEPAGLAIDGAGHLVVCDNGNGRIQLFGRDGRRVGGFPVRGWKRQTFSEPTACPGPDGGILVTVPLEKEVRLYSEGGVLLRTWKSGAPDVPAFESPMGVARDPKSGRVVICDLEGHLVELLPAKSSKRR